MRVFIAALVLIFSFQSWTKANDISELEIEGISVGDSLLDYMTKDEITQNTLAYFSDTRKYYIVGYSKNLSTYKALEIYLKTNDKSFTVKSITGGLYPKNLNECLKKKEKISKEIESSIDTLKFFSGTQDHVYYKNSKEHYSAVFLNDNFINIKCMFYDKKDKENHNIVDNLQVMFQTKEITDWVESGYK